MIKLHLTLDKFPGLLKKYVLFDFRQPEFLSQAYQSPEIKSRSEKYNKTFEFCIEKTGCEPKFEKMSSIYYAIQLKVSSSSAW